ACEVSLACGATPLTNGTKGDAAVFTHATLDRAWQSTVENQRPLLVMFTSDNCAYCVKMVRETYRHPSVERLLTGRTEGVLAHASDNQALVSRLGIRGYPTSMLVSPRGEVLMVVEGFLDAEAFAQRLGP